MALEKKIVEALKGLEDKSILVTVEGIQDKADAKEKVQKANDDLVSQRKDWEDKEKAYKATITENDTSIKDKDVKIKELEQSTLSPEELQKLKLAEKTQSDFNAVLEEVKGLKEKIEVSDKRAVDAEENTKKAKKSEKEQAQKTSISNELAKHKIIELKNETAMHTIFAKGHAGLETNESGELVEAYYTYNDKSEKVTSSLGKMVESFADENNYLISPSKNIGTGQSHDRTDVIAKGHFDTIREAKVAESNDWDTHFGTQ